MGRTSVLDRLSGYDLAIDLGTQSTQIYAAGRGVVLSEPSLAAVEVEGGRGHWCRMGCQSAITG